MHAAATASASAFPDTIGADGTIDEATVNKAVALLQSGMSMHNINFIALFFQQLYQSFSCMRLLGSWLVLFSCVRPLLRLRFYGTILFKVATNMFVSMFAENGVPMLVWIKGDSTKGAVRLSHDRRSVIVFDWKFPLVRKKKKFGTCACSACFL